LRARLAGHPLYRKIRTPDDIRTFMSFHVFAVWDFMSLLKALQGRLTCVSIPWRPTRWPESRRFINEIVLGEESDLFEGRAISHFELYLEAMEECGADTCGIRNLLAQVEDGVAMGSLDAPRGVREFLGVTFDAIQSGSPSAMAAAFTFGREDVIPEMFRELVGSLNSSGAGTFRKFGWYLERHIEVDGDEHGPLSLRMVADLCGKDDKLWEEAARAAETAIAARLALWDAIANAL
jgi:hypothetical protein